MLVTFRLHRNHPRTDGTISSSRSPPRDPSPPHPLLSSGSNYRHHLLLLALLAYLFAFLISPPSAIRGIRRLDSDYRDRRGRTAEEWHKSVIVYEDSFL